MERITVATLNIRNIADRWPERLPLLLADMAALQPDLMGLQEVVFAAQQDRVIGAAGERRYEAIRAYAGRPEYGNSILVGDRLRAAAGERLDLGMNRSALRLAVTLSGGSELVVVCTHLHHVPADESARTDQARALVAWLDARPEPAATVVVGDFNAEPVEPAYAVMREAGFVSAFLQANGAEPDVTWPSGIQAPGMDDDGDPGCLDYVWLRGPVAAEAARLVFDRPAVGDPTLYPSDHIGIVATLRVGA
jgi:endonuclease/exonuclease/phosphatase family metal-dependent hydrolase